MDVTLHEHVVPSKDNAGLVVSIEGDNGFSALSQIELDEKSSPDIWQTYRNLDEGIYKISATLYKWKDAKSDEFTASSFASLTIEVH